MILLYFIIPLLAFVIGYSLIENRYIKTVTYVLQFDQKKRIHCVSQSEYAGIHSDTCTHIVQLSDLHNCRYGRENKRLVEKIKVCRPDVILITGDMITKYQPAEEALYDLFRQLSVLCPCIYSLGNHELKERERYPERFADYIRKVQSYGIIISDNEKHELTLKNSVFRLSSYSSDLQQYKKRLRKKDTELKAVEIPAADTEGISILLSHDPELTDLYAETGYSLIFSGHLHGGIVRIPGGRGVISTRLVPFPKYDGGCYHLDESHVMIVSRGLGTHTIRFRLFNRPELVHTVIVSKQEA